MRKTPRYTSGPDDRDPQRGTIVHCPAGRTKRPRDQRKPGRPPVDSSQILPQYFVAYEFYLANPGASAKAVSTHVGITADTLRDWWARPGFRRGLQKAMDLIQNRLAVRMAHKLASTVEQIRELGRLYDSTPDFYGEFITKTYQQGLNARGEVAGEDDVIVGYREQQLRCQRSNARVKAQILRHIHDIVSPLTEHYDPIGSAL